MRATQKFGLNLVRICCENSVSPKSAESRVLSPPKPSTVPETDEILPIDSSEITPESGSERSPESVPEIETQPAAEVATGPEPVVLARFVAEPETAAEAEKYPLAGLTKKKEEDDEKKKAKTATVAAATAATVSAEIENTLEIAVTEKPVGDTTDEMPKDRRSSNEELALKPESVTKLKATDELKPEPASETVEDVESVLSKKSMGKGRSK